MIYFQYTDKEILHLKSKDPLLGQAIDKIGLVKREVEPDIFQALISSIISQQISIKGANTVKARLGNLVEEISPKNIYKLSLEDIIKCGMYKRKAEYIKGAAEAALEKTVDFNNLHKKSDEEVIKELTSIRGVGEWTAEMLLIHSLQRKDIVSFKDLGIRRGIMKLYGLDELTIDDFQVYRERYSPYGTVASLYIWEIGNE